MVLESRTGSGISITSNMTASKNPFSLYDFMGYFVPGAFMLFAVLAMCTTDSSFIRSISNTEMNLVTKIDNLTPNTFSVVIFLIVSYTSGHILSYVSSISIEFLSNRLFLYPSKYLLEIEDIDIEEPEVMDKYSFEYAKRKIYKKEVGAKRFILFIMLLSFFPVTLPMLIFSTTKCIRDYLTRPLDKELIKAIDNKMMIYSSQIGYKYTSSCLCCDSHRVIMHYVNVNTPNAPRKVDNYVALYGFLRSMSLVFSIIFVIALCSSVSTFKLFAPLDVKILFVLILLAVLPSITYLGYLKFYRRHTLENLMAFLVTPDMHMNEKQTSKHCSFLSCPWYGYLATQLRINK